MPSKYSQARAQARKFVARIAAAATTTHKVSDVVDQFVADAKTVSKYDRAEIADLLKDIVATEDKRQKLIGKCNSSQGLLLFLLLTIVSAESVPPMFSKFVSYAVAVQFREILLIVSSLVAVLGVYMSLENEASQFIRKSLLKLHYKDNDHYIEMLRYNQPLDGDATRSILYVRPQELQTAGEMAYLVVFAILVFVAIVAAVFIGVYLHVVIILDILNNPVQPEWFGKVAVATAVVLDVGIVMAQFGLLFKKRKRYSSTKFALLIHQARKERERTRLAERSGGDDAA